MSRRTNYIQIRLSDEEKLSYAAEADAVGWTISEWVRFRCGDVPIVKEPKKIVQLTPEVLEETWANRKKTTAPKAKAHKTFFKKGKD